MKRIKDVIKIVLIFAGLLISSPSRAETVVLTSTRMLDVGTGKLLADPQVIIVDGRISSVRTRGQPKNPAPAGARLVDAGDLTLLPGLIDVHVHLSDNPVYEGLRSLPFTDSYWTVYGTTSARTLLLSGFTTVRNLGRDLNDVGIKQAVDEGLILGPRIIPTAYQIGATGGHCDYGRMLPPSYSLSAPGMGDGPDELRQRVREQRKNGAEAIKVCATGGVFSRNPGEQQLREEELRAIVEEASMLGMKVAAHAHGAAGINASLRAGVGVIEHASFIDAEGIRLARQKGAWLSMDVYNTEYVQREGSNNGVPESALRTDREVAAIQRRAFQKAHAAGVGMVFGTDVGGSMPHSLAARQFSTMVTLGMKPIEVIRTATLNAAEAIGWSGQVGRLAPGHFADIVGVKGDPTQDIRLLERIPFVMKGGIVVRNDDQSPDMEACGSVDDGRQRC